MDKYIVDINKVNYIKDNLLVKFDGQKRLDKLLTKMETAFHSDIDLQVGTDKTSHIKSAFDKFMDDIPNMRDSKLESDINKMDCVFSTILTVGSSPLGDRIKLNFMFKKGISPKYISIILHATNTFCHLFKEDYDGLVINVCLDDNKRDLDIPANITDINKKIAYLQKYSLAFNVSGVTYGKKKIINLTKIEEITKLLFHELVHFIGLDSYLRDTDFKNKWSAELNENLNLSETYTEFISVIINSMYESIHLSKLINRSPNDIFNEIFEIEINYNLYLVANILKFYGYDKNTVKDFFNGKGKKINQPILLVEYCFLRAVLMLNIDMMMTIIPKHYMIMDLVEFYYVIGNDKELINGVKKCMDNKIPSKSVSYLAIDLDWSII